MAFPFTVEHRLPGWTLAWLRLAVHPAGIAKAADMRRLTAAACRRDYRLDTLSRHPTAAAVRRLFRAAGCDPTRYRPSSEALIRRILKGGELPGIHPLVDLNNCVSAAMAAPACVMANGSTGDSLVLRGGVEGERMESLRGDFDLAGKPLLADDAGPFGTPITDSRRVAVSPTTMEAWMVVYLPADVETRPVADVVADILAASPVARAGDVALTGSP